MPSGEDTGVADGSEEHFGETREELKQLAEHVASDFEATNRLLSFDEWYDLLIREPHIHARNAAQYVKDALDHFGRRGVRTPGGEVSRFKLYDRKFDGGHRLVGQEGPQNDLYEVLDGFCRLGRVNNLVLLHGPNGSAKSTLLECLQRGLEAYSHTDAGALYRFAWVFPKRAPKGGAIGFGTEQLRDALGDETYARLETSAIDARLSDENRDHPLFLLPVDYRKQLLDRLCPEEDPFVVSDLVRTGELSARNRAIFDALLNGYRGDLKRVLRHIQVERFFLSRTYRAGLVNVEPKQTVDARSFPVTGDKAFGALPAAVGGQALYGSQGDLVDANRGIINFSDLLKRPYEHYKYLLTATETGRVALDHIVLQLDMVFTGSANDINLLAFRATRSNEYQSFRQRLELIPVSYLLDYRVERKIYQEQVGDLLRGVHIAPHVPRILALWGVMSRLRRPDADNYDSKIKEPLRRLTPLQKADLYAYGRVPDGLNSDEARELLAAVPAMHKERFPHAVVRSEGGDHLLGDYEGSFGASVRDLKNVLLATAAQPGVTTVTVPSLFRELASYMEDSANHRWMALESAGSGFHLLDDEDDDRAITSSAYSRWLDLSDWEVREAMGLIDEARYLELFTKYVVHAKHSVKRERLFDEMTGELADPDEKFMSELEQSMDPNAGEAFRADVLGRIGAWALSHPNEDPAYDLIFPDYFKRMREDYYRKQKTTVAKGIQHMLEMVAEDEDDNDRAKAGEPGPARDRNAPDKKVRHALEVLLGEHDGDERRERHTLESLKGVLVELQKHRY